MPVLMIAEVPNLTEETYGGLVGQLMPLLKKAEGFIAHAGGPNPGGGWRVVEMWDSEAQAQTWFEQNVKPNLPPEIKPNRQYFPAQAAFSK